MSRRKCAQCSWRQSPDENDTETLDDHADTAGHLLCLVCRHSLTEHEPRTCTACVARARRVLVDIHETYALLPATMGHPSTQSYDRGGHSDDETRLPGGQALTLLGPGSLGGNRRRLTSSEIAAGVEGREHGTDNRPDDGNSIPFLLTWWADDWARAAGHTVIAAQTVTSAVAYLTQRTQWAADTHPAFKDYLDEIHRVRQELRIATATNDQPLRGAARCLDCNVRLELTNAAPTRCHGKHQPRECTYNHRGQRTCGGPYGPHNHPVCTCDRGGVNTGAGGTPVEWHCPRCRRTYRPEAYMLAVRAQIEEAGGRARRHKPKLPKYTTLTAAVTAAHTLAVAGDQQDTG